MLCIVVSSLSVISLVQRLNQGFIQSFLWMINFYILFDLKERWSQFDDRRCYKCAVYDGFTEIEDVSTLPYVIHVIAQQNVLLFYLDENYEIQITSISWFNSIKVPLSWIYDLTFVVKFPRSKEWDGFSFILYHHWYRIISDYNEVQWIRISLEIWYSIQFAQ